MNINKSNYEIYFIDYFDGNLSAEQSAELFLFLEKHPELKQEFDNFSNITLDIPEVAFPDHDILKKEEYLISESDQKLIAELEGDLTPAQSVEVTAWLKQNPQFEKDQRLFRATVSEPDLSIVFPEKKSLKKPVPFFVAYRTEIRLGIAAALVIAFLAGMVTIFNRTMEKQTIQVAEEKSSPLPTQEEFKTSGNLPDSVNASVEPLQNSSIPKENNITGKPRLADVNSPNHSVQTSNSGKHGRKNKQGNSRIRTEEIVLVQSLRVLSVPAVSHEADVIAKAETKKTFDPAYLNDNDQYLSLWEVIRNKSEKNVKKLVGKDDDELVAYADGEEYSRVRLIDVVSKGLETISNDKVKLESNYNSEKQNNSFSFSAGNFKIERK